VTALLQSLLDQTRIPAVISKLPFQRRRRRTHSISLSRLSGYVYFAAAVRQNPRRQCSRSLVSAA